MEVQNGAYIVVALLVLTDDLLVVSLAQESKRHAVTAERRLDNIGNIVLVAVLIKVCQILAGLLHMTAEVKIGTVGNAPELAPIGERESVFNVGGGA